MKIIILLIALFFATNILAQIDPLVHDKTATVIQSSWLESIKTNKGIYKNGEPFKGDFFLVNKKIESLSRFENGFRTGDQYSLIKHEDSSSNCEVILYQNGKAFEGSELKYENDYYQLHEYEKGQLKKIIVDANNPYAIPEAVIRFKENGFTTNIYDHEKNKQILNNKLTYSNKKKTNGSVTFFDNEKPAGKLLFRNNKITDLNFEFEIKDAEVNIALNKEGSLITVIKEPYLVYKYFPIFEFPTPLGHLDFINLPRHLLILDGNGSLYLDDDMKEAISDFEIKNGNFHSGEIIDYKTDMNTYSYMKYEEGKEIELKEGLSKEALIKHLEIRQ